MVGRLMMDLVSTDTNEYITVKMNLPEVKIMLMVLNLSGHLSKEDYKNLTE